MANNQFQPGAWSNTPTNLNYLCSNDVIRPSIDSKLYKKMCDYMCTFLLDSGRKEEICNTKYGHYESQRNKYPAVFATTPGAGAGALGVFTFAPAPQQTNIVGACGQQYVPGDCGDFTTNTTVTGVPVRVNDVIQIPNIGGTVQAGTYVLALVVDVDKAAGTFEAVPLDATAVIPAIAAGTGISIISNISTEGGCSPEGLNSGIEYFENELGILRDSYCATGSVDSMCLWVDENQWALKNADGLAERFRKAQELFLMFGQKITNPLITGGYRMTKGLVPTVLDEGIVTSYSAATGWGMQDLENLILLYDSEKCCGSEFQIWAGIKLSMAIDKNFANQFQNGAISYGSFDGCQEKALGFGFDSFCWGNYTFHKKTWCMMNDHQTLGLPGHTYNQEGLIIPIDRVADAKDASKKLDTISIKYLKDRLHKESIRDNFKIDGCDNVCVDFLSEIGLEVYGANCFGYIKVQP